jgi:hypothetical protein
MLAGGLAGSLGLVFWLSPPSSDRTLSLAAFLGLAPPEIRLASTYAPVREQLPVKLSPSGKQPAYTLLYPETPVAEIAPPKKPAVGKPLRQGKMKAMVPPTGKHAKVAVQPNKKEKTQTKAKSKKKKPEPQPRGAASLHVASSP